MLRNSVPLTKISLGTEKRNDFPIDKSRSFIEQETQKVNDSFFTNSLEQSYVDTIWDIQLVIPILDEVEITYI